MKSAVRFLGKLIGVAGLALMGVVPPAQADIPDELFKALGLERNAAPNVLYEAIVKRYRDPAQGAGKGKFADLWEPIAFSKYMSPGEFYEGPDLDFEVTARQCVECHQGVTPGWVHSWEKSVHADLDEIRSLTESDSRFYKQAMIKEVEGNLVSMGLLDEGENLKEVGCVDCHMGVGVEKGNHKTDLHMPDAGDCGQCHLQQFAERESERDTAIWPQGQWPDGHPSHALAMKANYETAIWAGMEEREVAEGCTMCHTTQNTCNSCHTRHEFSAAEARKPEACSTCHNGVDHPEFENFMMSKHGVVYTAHGDEWDWELPLKEAFEKGGQTGPTCQTCHFENDGEYGHNVVRKVRWGFQPMPSIAENLDHPWFEDRKEAWIATCSQCHSDRFARSYFSMIDNVTIDAVNKVEEARAVMQGLYDDKLLVGQTTNRPAPPEPSKDAPGGFYSLFWAEGNNPSAIDYEFTEMWEQRLMSVFKGVAHANPGGFTYTNAWSHLLRQGIRIRDADTQLREKAAMLERIRKLENPE